MLVANLDQLVPEYKATKYDPRCPTVTSPGLFRVEGGDRCTALHLTGATKPALVAPLGTTQIQRQKLMHIYANTITNT